MKKKIYLIQPTYTNSEGKLLKGKSLYIISLALPAISALIPEDWQKEFCIEYFEDVNYETDASVIGITSMGYDLMHGMEIASEFKKRGKTVIFGGYQAHFSSVYISDVCDSVIHGNPGIKDMQSILTDISINKLEKEYFFSRNIDFTFDYSVIADKKINFTPILSSIGCLNDCDFCCTAAVYKGKYKLRKIEYVISDMKQINKYTKKMGFVDSNIYNNREYTLRLCKRMIQEKFNFTWGGQSTIAVGDDKEVLKLLKKAGCRILFIGMETENQQNLDGMNKKYMTESYRNRVRNINRAGIKIAGFFMFGLDSDNAKTPQILSRFINSLGISLPILNILVPAPGTRIYEKLKNENRLTVNSESDFLTNNRSYNSACNTCFYKPKNMTPAEVEFGFLELNRRLASYYRIFRRSIDINPVLSIFLLYMNLGFRKEYLELKKRRSNGNN